MPMPRPRHAGLHVEVRIGSESCVCSFSFRNQVVSEAIKLELFRRVAEWFVEGVGLLIYDGESKRIALRDFKNGAVDAIVVFNGPFHDLIDHRNVKIFKLAS